MRMASDTKLQCVYCYKTKSGRFVRRRSNTGFSQNLNKPLWACYDCEPDTSKELETMANTQQATTVIDLNPVTRAKVQKEGLTLLDPLKREMTALKVTTPEEYTYADGLLTKIREARKRWASKLAPIIDPLAETLRSAKKAMEGSKALLNEVDKPLEQYEEHVRREMKVFKVEEARQLREAEQEQIRLQAEIEEKARKAAETKGPAKAKILRQIGGLQSMQSTIQTEQAAPVQAEGSGTRTKENWRVPDIKVLAKFVADGTLPADCILVNSPRMNAYFKANPEEMKAWPGVEIFTDVVIVAR